MTCFNGHIAGHEIRPHEGNHLMSTHAADCPKSFDGYESMACECAPTSDFDIAQAAAEGIVAPVAHLLAPAEHTRMVSSIMIDLDPRDDNRAAIARALRTLHRTRMAAENANFIRVTEQLTEIAALITRTQPVRANAHIAAAASAASVIGSWFVTAHSEIAPMIFRTRVESPVL